MDIVKARAEDKILFNCSRLKKRRKPEEKTCHAKTMLSLEKPINMSLFFLENKQPYRKPVHGLIPINQGINHYFKTLSKPEMYLHVVLEEIRMCG